MPIDDLGRRGMKLVKLVDVDVVVHPLLLLSGYYNRSVHPDWVADPEKII